ncbi:hypothetical protein D3C72_1877100 [compost metagenome]
MQGAGEGFEVEVRGLALDGPGVRVYIKRRAGAVRQGDIGLDREVRTVGLDQPLHHHVRLGLVQGVQYLLEAQAFGVGVGLVGAHGGVGQPDDFLADHREHAGEADNQDKEPDRQGEPAVDQEPQPGFGFFR